MSVIPFAMSNVSEVVIGTIDASATLSVGGGGGASVFAGIVVSAKGAPFELLHITKGNYKRQLGKAIHPSKGLCSEPIRHVAEAVEYGDGYLVRVVPEDARYPFLRIKKGLAIQPAQPSAGAGGVNANGGKENASEEQKKPAVLVAPKAEKPKDSVTPGNAPFGSKLEATEDSALTLYVVDGDPSIRRAVSMTAADPKRYGVGMFHLRITEMDDLGFEHDLESLLVSMNPEAMNDMNEPAYIETILENNSRCLRAIVGEGADELAGFPLTWLEGGTNGDMNNISAGQYQKALSVLRNAMVNYTAILGLGCYDTTVLANLATVCNERRIDGFMDIPSYLNYAGADKWINDLGLNNHRVAFYHFPYTAKDSFSGSKMLWGLSGVAFGAKAQGVRSVPDVGGWHFSPAGEERGVISRRSIKPLPGLDEPDYLRMYSSRINKIAVGTGGMLVIDDSLTCWKKEDYLRFQHVSSTMDAISRAFYGLAKTLKHQPDGLTLDALNRELPKLLDKFTSCGALVKPRDSDDGDSPYVIKIDPPAGGEIDLWKVTWSVCVTGTSRRIFGQPSLLR